MTEDRRVPGRRNQRADSFVESGVRKLLAAVTTALLASSALIVLAPPASASCAAPTIELAESGARRGALIDIRGSGWGTACYDNGPPPSGEGPLGAPTTANRGEAVGFTLVQGDQRWELGYYGIKPNSTFTNTVQIPREAKTGPATIVVETSVPEISVETPLVIEAGPAFPTLPKTRFHMTPSDRTVSPGQVISIKVRGPGVDRWGGGVDSYLERRNGDGRWEQIYMLHWFGQGDTPTIREPGSGIEEPLVQATPFDVIIPPVPAGEYRITRRFAVAPGYSQKDVVLATPITVRPCPRGQRATFVTTTAPTGDVGLGSPACVPTSS